MRLNRSSQTVAIALLACLAVACGQQQGLSPLSPSELSSRRPDDPPQSRGASPAPRPVDYHDGEHPAPSPMPDPGADPGTSPTPNPNPPPPDGVPVPVQLTISIIGSFGNLAFAPNPQHAAVGNMVVWANNDVVQHTIVLDNGTQVGTLAPGQSSTPITLITETTGYRCTLHPSMVGQIAPVPAVPPDGQAPVPPAGGAPMPNEPAPDYGGDNDDGYEDDYY